MPITQIAVWSGDAIVKDEEGFLYFIGREDDMIKSSGYPISPTELEEEIYDTGLVNESAAIGISHCEVGQGVVIVCHSGQSDDETRESIIAACSRALPNYMQPKEVLFRSAFPRNPNGKIDRRGLASELEDIFQENFR